jgi:hypothetical protein
MELAEFTRALNGLSPSDLHRLAVALDEHAASAADEVDAWRATLTIDRALRRTHRIRIAARAASVATHAVLAAAETGGIKLPDAEVTHVARAAAEIARGMVAGDEAATEVRFLFGAWTLLLGALA